MTVGIEGFIALVLLLTLLYGPWQQLVVAVVRQQLFGLRDEWFDLAASGKIEFSDPAYRETRDLLNTIIRYAHTAVWYRMLLTHPLTPKSIKDEPLKRIQDQGVRRHRRLIMNRMSLIMLGGMVLRSPLLLGLSPIIAIVGGLFAIIRPMKITRLPAVFASEVTKDACLSGR